MWSPRGRRGAVGAALVAAWVIASTPAAVPAATRARDAVLPPITLSATTLRLGDTLTISGTGCVDPASHSGTGLTVIAVRLVDGGRGGISPRILISTAVANDGSFSGAGRLAQPMPDGRQPLHTICTRGGGLDARTTNFSARTDAIDLVAPSLPDLSAAAGGRLTFTLPCGTDGYVVFDLHLTAVGKPSIQLGIDNPFFRPAGSVVTSAVPASALPGIYDATGACTSEAGTSANYAHFTVEIRSAAQPTGSTTPSEQPPGAPGASPVLSRARFTG